MTTKRYDSKQKNKTETMIVAEKQINHPLIFTNDVVESCGTFSVECEHGVNVWVEFLNDQYNCKIRT